MPVLFTISLRNLLRQKRRNILLGIAIAFGTMILIVANSFSHGISDVIFNKIISYTSGHISVAFSENGNSMKTIFRDGDDVVSMVRKTIPDITRVDEAIGVFTRAIGNGKGDNVIMVGMDLNTAMSEEERLKSEREAAENFKMTDGSFLDIRDSTQENPVLVSVSKAKSLNIKKGDMLRVRFRDMNGQDQAARLTVVGLFKPANVFMSMPIFLEKNTLKRMLGYGPHDIAQLNINIKNPKKNAVRYADSLHARLKPPLALIEGSASAHGPTAAVSVFGVKGDSASQAITRSTLTLTAGDSAAAWGKEGVLIGTSLATTLGIGVGDTCRISYASKHSADSARMELVVTALFAPTPLLGDGAVLVRDNRFFKDFLAEWPAPAGPAAWRPAADNPLLKVLSTEWLLLKRSKTTQEMMQQFRNVAKLKQKGDAIDVRTMYESASQVLQLEVALNLITLIAVMILFFIILIGVVNTLRMTIRERTREIGTVRAIGMQRNDVRNVFILETFLLALFSAVVGVAGAFGAMAASSLWAIRAEDNPLSMLLVNSHLHFVPSAISVVLYVALILAIAVVTAYFPARRAARLSAAEALRHYE